MGKKAIGTYGIAKMCHVTPATVGRWVDGGKIPFFTTGGGHRRVWNTDVAKFLKSLNMPIPRELLAGESVKILIVDDEAPVRRSIIRTLRKVNASAEIYEAKDGFEAGHKTGSLMPSLVILDLKLPGINGYDVCKMIRRDKHLKDTKILAITGYGHKDTAKQTLKVGADDFLPKPFDGKRLISKIQKLVPNFVN